MSGFRYGRLTATDHEKFAPASDIDLFLYGLDEQEAIRKIKQIEKSVRDTILSEVTVVRTKNAITICEFNVGAAAPRQLVVLNPTR